MDNENNILVILDDALSPEHLVGRAKEAFDYSFTSCGVRKPFSCLGGGIVFTDNEEKYSVLKEYILRTRKKMKTKNKIIQFILSLSFFFAFRSFIYPFTLFLRRKTRLLDSFFNEVNNDVYIIKPEYYWDMCGFQKRIGINQLKKIKFMINRRREIGNLYFNLFCSSYPEIKQYWEINTPYSHIPFLHPNRDELQKYLLENGIETEKYFDYIIPELNQYKDDGKFHRAKHLSNQIINLPIYVTLKKRTILKIVETIKQFDIYVKKNTPPPPSVLL